MGAVVQLAGRIETAIGFMPEPPGWSNATEPLDKNDHRLLRSLLRLPRGRTTTSIRRARSPGGTRRSASCLRETVARSRLTLNEVFWSAGRAGWATPKRGTLFGHCACPLMVAERKSVV